VIAHFVAKAIKGLIAKTPTSCRASATTTRTPLRRASPRARSDRSSAMSATGWCCWSA
jgi:hypothetical protein